MQNLGFTRSSNRHDHILQTPDTFVRAPLPGMVKAAAIVHISPVRGAKFTQYTVEFEAGGSYLPGPAQAFVYVLSGAVKAGGKTLSAGGYCYMPPGSPVLLTADEATRATIIEKPMQPGTGAPKPFFGREEDAAPVALGGDETLLVRAMVPNNPVWDFAVNTMEYQPGARLSMVEIHMMEHGLLMLEGEGIYRLGEHWYPAKAGDFIWMAPYCPQWFGALGKTPAKYLIYKDWNRHPLA